MKKLIITTILSPILALSQNTGFDKALKIGEIAVGGLSLLKSGKSQDNNSTTVENFCVSNKLTDKVTFKLAADDKNDKELVIPAGGKECVYKVDKGVWRYVVTLANGEVYKKGEYNLEPV
ncbi:MAG: hypothetical protein QM564_13900 [Bergeyella sp.]